MTTRAADDFDAIRARMDQLRALRSFDRDEAARRAQTDVPSPGYEAVRASLDLDHDRPKKAAPMALDVPVAPERIPAWATLATALVAALATAAPPGFLHPDPSPRARAHAREGLRVEQIPSLAAPTVEEPASARSEFRERGIRST